MKNTNQNKEEKIKMIKIKQNILNFKNEIKIKQSNKVKKLSNIKNYIANKTKLTN